MLPDVIAGVVIVAIAAWGFRAGVLGMLAFAAFAAGAVVGAKLAPLLLDEGHRSTFALVVAVPAALLLGALLAAIVERGTMRMRRWHRQAGVASAFVGAALAVWVGVVVVWLGGALVAQFGSLHDPVLSSAIIGGLDDAVSPPGPDETDGKRPFDAFPIIASAGPRITPANPGVVRDPQVLRADHSVAKIGVASSCGGATGSGWVAADGIVVTNAHVAAGADAMTARIRGVGPPYPATPIWFDPVNDVALLRVPALHGVPPLPIARSPQAGTEGAALGFPAGRHAIRPARIGRTTPSIAGRMQDAPRGFPPRLGGRLVTPFRGQPEPGSSGGPVVDTRGRVIATVFGGEGTRRRGRVRPGAQGLGVPNEFVRSALRRAGPPVATGSCETASRRSHRR